MKITDTDRPDAFFLRGFLVTSRDYRKDGFLDPTYTPRDFADVQRMEILQGPSSVLYGAGQPSGSVNLITKNPMAQSMQDVTVQFGSFGLQRYTVDSTGAMNQDGSLLYRFNGAYQDTESFRDFAFDQRTFAAPAMTWVVDNNTTLTWKAEYEYDRRMYDSGVAAVNGPGAAHQPLPGRTGERFPEFPRLPRVARLESPHQRRLGTEDRRLFALLRFHLGGNYPLSAPVWGCRRLFLSHPTGHQSAPGAIPVGDRQSGRKSRRTVLTHNMVFGMELGWFNSQPIQRHRNDSWYPPSTALIRSMGSAPAGP